MENEHIKSQLDAYRRALYVPLVEKLGYEYREGESPDDTQLRIVAVGGAAAAGDEGVLKELRTRFGKYIAGDEAAVPADLLSTTFAQSVKHGGVEEYEAVLKLFEAGKNPSVHQASMYVYLRVLQFFMNRRLIAVVVQARSRRDARPEAD